MTASSCAVGSFAQPIVRVSDGMGATVSLRTRRLEKPSRSFNVQAAIDVGLTSRVPGHNRTAEGSDSFSLHSALNCLLRGTDRIHS